MTVYYEIVGFLPNGGYIQKGYDYGCAGEQHWQNSAVAGKVQETVQINIVQYSHKEEYGSVWPVSYTHLGVLFHLPSLLAAFTIKR